MSDGLSEIALEVSRSTMRRLRWPLVVAAVFVAGYAGNALASRTSQAEWNSTPQPYTMTYHGRALHCLVVEDGAEAGNIGALSCDFARFWGHK